MDKLDEKSLNQKFYDDVFSSSLSVDDLNNVKIIKFFIIISISYKLISEEKNRLACVRNGFKFDEET